MGGHGSGELEVHSPSDDKDSGPGPSQRESQGMILLSNKYMTEHWDQIDNLPTFRYSRKLVNLKALVRRVNRGTLGISAFDLP